MLSLVLYISCFHPPPTISVVGWAKALGRSESGLSVNGITITPVQYWGAARQCSWHYDSTVGWTVQQEQLFFSHLQNIHTSSGAHPVDTRILSQDSSSLGVVLTSHCSPMPYCNSLYTLSWWTQRQVYFFIYPRAWSFHVIHPHCILFGCVKDTNLHNTNTSFPCYWFWLC